MFCQFEDHRVIFCPAQPAGDWRVLAQRHEIMFRDGTARHLHPVDRGGMPQTFLRAVRHEGLSWVITDLRHHSTEIEADILRLQPRDTAGVVLFTLRAAYPTAVAFMAQVLARPVQAWWHVDGCAQVAA